MKTALAALAAGTIIAFALCAAPAQAQNSRSFVSAQGSDTNNCALTTPCRTLQVAVNNTNAGGEVVVLNSAGYGTVSINKSITINSIGVEGAITTTSGTVGVTVTAGSGSTVRLHNLTLIGGGVGTTGISITGGGAVIVDDCAINGFTGDGITYAPSVSGTLSVLAGETINNGGNGVTVAPTGGGTWSALLESHAQGNTIGFMINGKNATGTLNAYVAVGTYNNTIGVEATSSGGQATTTVMAANGIHAAFNSQTGLLADGTAVMYVDRYQATGNGLGWQATGGGTLKSYGDNEVNGNTSDTAAPSGKISEE